MILHIPHSSRFIPKKVRKTILLSDSELERELLLMTDAYTYDLFTIEDPAVTAIVYPVSRLVVDPERFLDDDMEPLAACGMGAVYTRTSDGRPLRKELLSPKRQSLIEAYYLPHHIRLSQACAAELAILGKCLVIDCHSFPSRLLPYELDQDMSRPDICLGSDPFHTPDWLMEYLTARFLGHGLDVKRNRPFSGTLVPQPYYRVNARVMSIMIEVNRGLYLDETTGMKGADYLRIQIILRNVISDLAATWWNTIDGF